MTAAAAVRFLLGSRGERVIFSRTGSLARSTRRLSQTSFTKQRRPLARVLYHQTLAVRRIRL